MESHPLYLQLQFLPFLYADEKDLVFTTQEPDPGYFARLNAFGFQPPQRTSSAPQGAEVQYWGKTPSLEAWADDHQLVLKGPVSDAVRKVNSKAFSYTHAPKLKGSQLLNNWEELIDWFHRTKTRKVLKTCYGVSGRGHFHLQNLDNPSLLEFTKREWEKRLPILAEPWVERVLDFSTQWYLHRDGRKEYLGFTICENDARGHYLGTLVGVKEPVHLKAHLQEAEHLLDCMQEEGYFGNVGFDAMVYDRDQLQPIVEINARKTMGWVAIAIRNRLFPERALAIRLQKKTEKIGSLLPLHAGSVSFQRQLCAELVE